MPAARKRGKRQRVNDSKKYQRYAKPPYSYVGMVIVAIEASSTKKLTLAEILQELTKMFPFFSQEYTGWRDSIRHNLSNNDCFVKVLRDSKNSAAKRNFWAVDSLRIPHDAFRRQETVISRSGAYALDLRDELVKYSSYCKSHVSELQYAQEPDGDAFPHTRTIATETIQSENNAYHIKVDVDSESCEIIPSEDGRDVDNKQQEPLAFSIENILSDKFKGRRSTCPPSYQIPEVNNYIYKEESYISYDELFVNNHCYNNHCYDSSNYYRFHVQSAPSSHHAGFQTMPRPIMSPLTTPTLSPPVSYNPLSHFAEFVLAYS